MTIVQSSGDPELFYCEIMIEISFDDDTILL